ncbi:hypothetical protein BpHYR1_015768 [Brachionus plicatilis]|uniref:Uncharacterized protein n=1 Tax=Brachionus plicatilis TaxID=10195 RepID=A0A3M7Q8X4_BRAPC|nr:hypothetical protein BpHYR1_015768 [Brachionus plicatilis]
MSPNQHLAAMCWILFSATPDFTTTSCPFIPTDPKPCWKNGNYEQLSSLLNSVNLQSSLNNPVIDVNYETLLSAYNSGVSKFVPSYTNSPISIANKQSPKWFNKSLKKLTQLKYKLFICTRIHPGNSDFKDQYRTVCLQPEEVP